MIMQALSASACYAIMFINDCYYHGSYDHVVVMNRASKSTSRNEIGPEACLGQVIASPHSSGLPLGGGHGTDAVAAAKVGFL